MKLGIYDIGNCGTNLTILERFAIYKSVGFTHVGFYMDNSYLGGENYQEMFAVAKDLGLIVEQVHLDYKNSNMFALNEENEFFEYLENKINEGIKYGVNHLIVHASKGDAPQPISHFSLNKIILFDKILNGSDTKLCFENVRNNSNIADVLNLKLNNVGMCYDSGHAHAYSNEVELLTKYSNVIYCTHLHDNMGSDTHNVIGTGNINWDIIYPLINNTNRKVDYLECFMGRNIVVTKDKFKKFVEDNYNSYKNIIGG